MSLCSSEMMNRDTRSEILKVNKEGLCELRHDIIIFHGSHFDLPPSSIHRMTGLGNNFVSALTYVHFPTNALRPK